MLVKEWRRFCDFITTRQVGEGDNAAEKGHLRGAAFSLVKEWRRFCDFITTRQVGEGDNAAEKGHLRGAAFSLVKEWRRFCDFITTRHRGKVHQRKKVVCFLMWVSVWCLIVRLCRCVRAGVVLLEGLWMPYWVDGAF